MQVHRRNEAHSVIAARAKLGAFAAGALAFASAAFAQRANENAVAEASDAFGTAVGRESIDMLRPMTPRT